MSGTCLDCFAANEYNPLEQIIGFCLTPTDLQPLGRGGHHGLMLASKYPMKNKQLVVFPDSWIDQNAALYAEIEGVQVGCVQLAADIPALSGLPYLGN